MMSHVIHVPIICILVVRRCRYSEFQLTQKVNDKIIDNMINFIPGTVILHILYKQL